MCGMMCRVGKNGVSFVCYCLSFFCPTKLISRTEQRQTRTHDHWLKRATFCRKKSGHAIDFDFPSLSCAEQFDNSRVPRPAVRLPLLMPVSQSLFLLPSLTHKKQTSTGVVSCTFSCKRNIIASRVIAQLKDWEEVFGENKKEENRRARRAV